MRRLVTLLLVDEGEERPPVAAAAQALAAGGDHAPGAPRRPARGVRRDDSPWVPPQRMVLGQRLRVRHVEARAPDEAFVERSQHVLAADDLSPRDIDDDG